MENCERALRRMCAKFAEGEAKAARVEKFRDTRVICGEAIAVLQVKPT